MLFDTPIPIFSKWRLSCLVEGKFLTVWSWAYTSHPSKYECFSKLDMSIWKTLMSYMCPPYRWLPWPPQTRSPSPLRRCTRDRATFFVQNNSRIPIHIWTCEKWDTGIPFHAGTVISMVRIKWERGNEKTLFSMAKNLSVIWEFMRDLWFGTYEIHAPGLLYYEVIFANKVMAIPGIVPPTTSADANNSFAAHLNIVWAYFSIFPLQIYVDLISQHS